MIHKNCSDIIYFILVVTLIGRSPNTIPFSATILNSESNIQIKNGVMHVIRGI